MLKRATVERKQLLTLQKQRIVRYIILHKMPVDYGIDSYQWTAEHVRTVIEQKWQIKISCVRLYQLFDKCDNARTLHRATPYAWDSDRELHRTKLEGEEPITA